MLNYVTISSNIFIGNNRAKIGCPRIIACQQGSGVVMSYNERFDNLVASRNQYCYALKYLKMNILQVIKDTDLDDESKKKLLKALYIANESTIQLQNLIRDKVVV
ncbi:MAG: hypothetical protein AB7G87_04030 [Clostridia bacterium]